MTVADRWLLPDGFEEILPNRSFQVEYLRRQLLDLYHTWGYDLIIPPLVEFADSLLSGSGSDLDLLTFKVTDQLSGRMMGLRADITTQSARIDAHSLQRRGPNRLCYSGTVVYTRPRYLMDSRCPIQVGVELYGEPGLEADVEVVSLMIESLKTAGIENIHLELGHVGIIRSLLEFAGLTEDQEGDYFDLLRSKARAEIDNWLRNNIDDPDLRLHLGKLPALVGDESILQKARKALGSAPDEVGAALDELEAVVALVRQRAPDISLCFDLGELEGYRYHTGMVFAAFAPGIGRAIGNGGRYDHVGEVFGRSRPATGFSLDLKSLSELSVGQGRISPGIYVPATEDDALWPEVERLRTAGERVVCGFSGQTPDYEELHCDRELVMKFGKYVINPINN